ncbi:hypothetical protein SCLCIDRAFT_1213199 [Scleroderma citrinum Foug A]|uniref:Uncharacterized protein n=1 Tax=Scleroderma citrinum Foug A TaxID=1036808 RepID=A0A0C3AIG5_9AGAM|nr:hypothetical protein SCLCIDRAFT_1213199 [Scleroderma citrinum Foug A]
MASTEWSPSPWMVGSQRRVTQMRCADSDIRIFAEEFGWSSSYFTFIVLEAPDGGNCTVLAINQYYVIRDSSDSFQRPASTMYSLGMSGNIVQEVSNPEHAVYGLVKEGLYRASYVGVSTFQSEVRV